MQRTRGSRERNETGDPEGRRRSLRLDCDALRGRCVDPGPPAFGPCALSPARRHRAEDCDDIPSSLVASLRCAQGCAVDAHGRHPATTFDHISHPSPGDHLSTFNNRWDIPCDCPAPFILSSFQFRYRYHNSTVQQYDDRKSCFKRIVTFRRLLGKMNEPIPDICFKSN